jgi:hypothetical protein
VTPVPGSGIRNSDFFDNFEIVCVLCVGGSSFFGADYWHWVEGNQPSSLNFCWTGQCFCVDACLAIFIIVIQLSVLWIRTDLMLIWIRISTGFAQGLSTSTDSFCFSAYM